MMEWQSKWSLEVAVAGWLGESCRLLPGEPVGLLDHRVSQALTGHGAFSGYLHRFRIIASPEYLLCDAPVDNAEHTIFICPH